MTPLKKLKGTDQDLQKVVVLPVKQRVLIVDDDAVNRQIWEEMLSGICTLALASNGDEALQVFERFRPGLVVLDRMMPGMHGDAVLAKIRALDPAGETRIVMHSMLEKASDQIDGMHKGADLYIPKSTNMEVAVTQVQSLLEMQKTSHAAQLFKVAREQLRNDSYSSNLIAKGIFRHAALLTDSIRAKKVNIVSIARFAAQRIGQKIGEPLKIPINVYEDEQMPSRGVMFGDRDFLDHALEMVLKRACEVTAEDTTVHLGIREVNRHIIIAIEDSGPTIPIDDRRHIFHFSCDVQNIRVALPIAWETANRHLGDLVLTDGRNGMCFTFTFPTAELIVETQKISQ